MKVRFRVGDKVRLTSEARQNECYRRFAERVLTVESIATAYMPASDFYRKGKPGGFHPGFDSSVDCALYDLKNCSCSLYDWELEEAV
jgi:hypothetical protein